MYVYINNVYYYYYTEMAHIYERVGATIIERGESFYRSLMPKVVEDLEKRGAIHISCYTVCVCVCVMLYTVVVDGNYMKAVFLENCVFAIQYTCI